MENKMITTKEFKKAQEDIKEMNKHFASLMNSGNSKEGIAYYDSIKDAYEEKKALIREYLSNPYQRLLRAILEH